MLTVWYIGPQYSRHTITSSVIGLYKHAFSGLFKVQKHGSKCPWKLAKIEQTGFAALTLASQAKLALLLRCTGTVGADCSYHLNSGFSWVTLLTCYCLWCIHTGFWTSSFTPLSLVSILQILSCHLCLFSSGRPLCLTQVLLPALQSGDASRQGI